MKLSNLTNGQTATIRKVRGIGAFRKRIMEMGFIAGKEVTVVKNAPLLDPIEYKIMGYNVSLRRSEAELISVGLGQKAENTNSYGGVISENRQKVSKNKDCDTVDNEKCKKINIALVGNPNCGKTTLFNYASGSKEKVGNYSGVTVDSKDAIFKHNGYTFNIGDLPGTYSLTAYTPEELYVRNYISDTMPDIVINVVDASNLERNLYLTTQLIDMDIKVIIALNMYDELEAKGDNFDYKSLGKMLGIPIIPTISSKGKGITDLFEKAIEVYEDKDPIVRHIHVNYGHNIEDAISNLQSEIKIDDNKLITDRISPRFLSIKLLENDNEIEKNITSKCKNHKKILDIATIEREKLKKALKENSETLITDAKYGFIAGALKETLTEGVLKRRKKTEMIDTFITHRLWGFPIFLLFMWLTFKATFTLGAYPMDWIEGFVGLISSTVAETMADGPLKDLIIDGIIGGVGGVFVFMPNILILFFFISFMEDTGYMARAVFIMDKLMHKIGLHGRSFIPLIMGFGCSVPAIMATRTIDSRKNRLVTMLIIPFMSCGAKIPVYVLLISAFFPDHKSSMMMLIYSIGVLIAILAALTFKKTILKEEDSPFVMELPPYRMPTFRTTLQHMWEKGVEYLKKMGGVILVGSIIIWVMGYYPREFDKSSDYNNAVTQTEKSYDAKIINAGNDQKVVDKLKEQKQNELTILEEGERLSNSYIGRTGHFIEPIIKPLGYDWKMGVAIVTGFAAKEVVVSTMGVLYQADLEADEESETLISSIKDQKYIEGPKKGKNVFTPLVAFGFMIFVLLYVPCVATIAAVKKESGSWKWAAFSGFYTTAIAWFVALLIYQIGSLII